MDVLNCGIAFSMIVIMIVLHCIVVCCVVLFLF